MIHLIFFLISTIFINFSLCNETVEVNLKQGGLKGKVEKSLLREKSFYSFKGVPYAEPPIGELRFKPPKPHKGWEDTYEANTNKPTCVMFNGRMRNGEPYGLSGTEDCLHLSIFTPSLEENLPVVVFDYNDNFRLGFNGSDTYSPEIFIEEDVIVVFFNHRLGVFGYLTTEDDVIPPNAGLKDFILGLEWIRDNIKQFGGDPTRVVLMGNRSGASLANMLLYSEKAKGLFSGIIMQSGTALEAVHFYDKPKDIAFKLGDILDIKTDDSETLLKELQQFNATILATEEIKAADTEYLYKYQMNVYPFAPVIEKFNEDAVLTSLPEVAKIVNDVPIIIGFNSREGLDLLSMFIFEPRMLQDVGLNIALHFPIRSGFRFERNSAVFEEAASEIYDFYLEEGYLNVKNILEYSVCTGDEIQTIAIDHAAKKLAADLKSNVYYYLFDFRGSLNENSEFLMKYSRYPLGNWGATITDELCYLHLCSRIRKNYVNLLKLTSVQPEIRTLKKMVRMWTNFAKTGNPTPENDDIIKDLTWNPIDKDNTNVPAYLHITKTMKMKKSPIEERVNFWNKFLERYSKMTVDGVVTDTTKDEL